MATGNTPLNPPDSPPVGPVIPEGLATKIGKIVAVLFAGLAAANELGLELDAQTNALIDNGLVILGILMGGRYLQAAAKYRSGQE